MVDFYNTFNISMVWANFPTSAEADESPLSGVTSGRLHPHGAEWLTAHKKMRGGGAADWVFEGSKHFQKEVKILINYSGAWAGWKMSAALHMLRWRQNKHILQVCEAAALRRLPSTPRGNCHSTLKGKQQNKAKEAIYWLWFLCMNSF